MFSRVKTSAHKNSFPESRFHDWGFLTFWLMKKKKIILLKLVFQPDLER